MPGTALAQLMQAANSWRNSTPLVPGTIYSVATQLMQACSDSTQLMLGLAGCCVWLPPELKRLAIRLKTVG